MATYKPYLVGTASTAEEIEALAAREASLPPLSRLALVVQLAPDADVQEVVEQIEEACRELGLLHLPELPDSYTVIQDSSILVAYAKPEGEVETSAWWVIFIPIAIGLILYFLVPGVQELVNNIISIVILMAVMKMMIPMMEAIGPPKPPPPGYELRRPEPQPPIEQRIASRIESIADSIERIGRVFNRSKEAGASATASVASDIASVAKEVHKSSAPREVKASAMRKLDEIDEKLREYEEQLTPRQKEILAEERRIVEELRSMYD